MTSGIYWIRNTVNGKFYIGSTTNFYNRWKTHKSDLNRGMHDNSYLQRSWEKYGAKSFKFEVLEYTDRPEEVEQWYLDNTRCLDRRYGYNLMLSSNGCKHSKESIEKIRRKAIGRKPSDKTRALLVAQRTGKKCNNSRPMEKNPNAKAVDQFTKDGTFVRRWSCAKEAMISLNGKSQASISQCVLGNIPSAYGYKWKYS